jgi:hypothetical protein
MGLRRYMDDLVTKVRSPTDAVPTHAARRLKSADDPGSRNQIANLRTDLKDGPATFVTQNDWGESAHALATDGLVGVADARCLDPNMDFGGP